MTILKSIINRLLRQGIKDHENIKVRKLLFSIVNYSHNYLFSLKQLLSQHILILIMWALTRNERVKRFFENVVPH